MAERQLPKLNVAGSIPVSRSINIYLCFKPPILFDFVILSAAKDLLLRVAATLRAQQITYSRQISSSRS